MIKKFFLTYAVALAAIVTFTFAAAAQTSPKSDFQNIKIGNFGQMDDNFYRGAQPMPDDYKSLADIGIKTIIDLRNDPTDYEKSDAEAVGIKYINIPMSGWKSPSDSDLKEFLAVANDTNTGKFYVHCKAGIHRTGVVGAVYRMTKYSWGYDQAYQEMKNYNFSSGLVHGALKSYVKNYSKKLESEKSVAGVVPAAQSN
jgi:protein tyrosine/serine phosphatase